MNGQGKLLTHFLKNADKLIIPVYQRNYDWKTENCKQLYDDLIKVIRRGLLRGGEMPQKEQPARQKRQHDRGERKHIP